MKVSLIDRVNEFLEKRRSTGMYIPYTQAPSAGLVTGWLINDKNIIGTPDFSPFSDVAGMSNEVAGIIRMLHGLMAAPIVLNDGGREVPSGIYECMYEFKDECIHLTPVMRLESCVARTRFINHLGDVVIDFSLVSMAFDESLDAELRELVEAQKSVGIEIEAEGAQLVIKKILSERID